MHGWDSYGLGSVAFFFSPTRLNHFRPSMSIILEYVGLSSCKRRDSRQPLKNLLLKQFPLQVITKKKKVRFRPKHGEDLTRTALTRFEGPLSYASEAAGRHAQDARTRG